MKFKTLVFSTALLLIFLSFSQAFGEKLEMWLSTCHVDKFTDEKTCSTFVNAGSEGNIYRIQFFMASHINEDIYFFNFGAFFESDNCLNSNVIRIDKNDAIFFEGQDIIGDKAHRLLEQMLAGKTAIARCGDVDFTFPLNGFPEIYESVKKNMDFDPRKK